MANSAPGVELIPTIERYNISLHVWPQYSFIGGERRQAGFEVELTGCHSLDPEHLDPSCPSCHGVRAVLLLIAENVTKPPVSDRKIPLLCEIYSHPASIVCTPRSGNRPMVNVSINIGCTCYPDHASECEVGALDEIKRRLAELGIHEL